VTLPPRGYRHGLRVRVGASRQPGVLLRCERRDGTGSYWRIRLQSGQWLWPNECVSLVIDGPGDTVNRCQDCGMLFLTDDPTAPICARCDYEVFGVRAETDDERSAYTHVARARRARTEK